MSILRAKKITKTFTEPTQVKVLKNISLSVDAGTSVAIMGASGEGKSTLLQILGTLDKPTSGSLEIAGKALDGRNAARVRNSHIGFVFQSYNLLSHYTAVQNVLMPALIAGMSIRPGSDAYEHGLDLLHKVGLSKRVDFATKLLSGGEKQRVAIARALCNNPEIVLADEPSGNLDHGTSAWIHELLLSCVEEMDKALIVVTHDQDLAALCDRKLVLCNGKLIED